MPAQHDQQTQVAVVLRTRNRPLLLARALASAAAQTYADYVVIVVNDTGDPGPVDDAVAQVADRALGRFQVVHNTVSRGREAALNIGLEASLSCYVAVLDDDDTWASSFLAQTVDHLERTGDLAVATRSEVIYERIDGETVVTEGRELLASDRNQVTLLETIVRNYTHTGSLVYRRDVLDTIGRYDEALPVLADWDFLLRLLRHGEVGFIDGNPLAFWHRRPASVGDARNSVEGDEHTRWDVLVRDRYLRADLARHEGLGYLLFVSELQDRDARIAQARGAHIAGAVHKIDTELLSMRDTQTSLAAAVHHLHGTQDELLRQLVEMNRNLISQNNRIVAQFALLGERVERLESLLDRRLAGQLR